MANGLEITFETGTRDITESTENLANIFENLASLENLPDTSGIIKHMDSTLRASIANRRRWASSRAYENRPENKVGEHMVDAINNPKNYNDARAKIIFSGNNNGLNFGSAIIFLRARVVVERPETGDTIDQALTNSINAKKPTSLPYGVILPTTSETAHLAQYEQAAVLRCGGDPFGLPDGALIICDQIFTLDGSNPEMLSFLDQRATIGGKVRSDSPHVFNRRSVVEAIFPIIDTLDKKTALEIRQSLTLAVAICEQANRYFRKIDGQRVTTTYGDPNEMNPNERIISGIRNNSESGISTANAADIISFMAPSKPVKSEPRA